jgi:hypothetical protein
MKIQHGKICSSKYRAFIDKVEHNCHFLAGTEIVSISVIHCFYGAIPDLFQETLVALDSESCSSSRKPGSDSCVQLYQ